jgi:hypothetical protein
MFKLEKCSDYKNVQVRKMFKSKKCSNFKKFLSFKKMFKFLKNLDFKIVQIPKKNSGKDPTILSENQQKS